jgi:hypothetical protein
MSFITQSPVPLPIDVGVINDDFDVSTITTTDLIVAAISVVSAVVFAYLAKKALRRTLNGIRRDAPPGR